MASTSDGTPTTQSTVSSISAGSASLIDMGTDVQSIELQNESGADWYVNVGDVAPTTTAYHYRVRSGSPPFSIKRRRGFRAVYIYAVAASVLSGTGKNCSVLGYTD